MPNNFSIHPYLHYIRLQWIAYVVLIIFDVIMLTLLLIWMSNGGFVTVWLAGAGIIMLCILDLVAILFIEMRLRAYCSIGDNAV